MFMFPVDKAVNKKNIIKIYIYKRRAKVRREGKKKLGTEKGKSRKGNFLLRLAKALF